ncbi:hypothetical protein [Bergeyella sp. RCAD1439]|uniref:hypothetical protein n=1 Tax=Bergeyella anatis TaxID=3113737 RepID=UPI002E17794A|nr:hypothetical protein [Bergeyella sp. RCAD1439]
MVSKTEYITVEKNKNSVVTITIEAKKIYDADIKVDKNKTPLPGVKVYALDELQKNALIPLIQLGGSKALSGATSVTTGNDGIARFSNLPTGALNNKYFFVVVTREPVIGAGINGAYEMISLTMDGTKQTGNITIESNSFSVNISSVDSPKGLTVGLYKDETLASLGMLPAYSKTLEDGESVKFEDIEPGNYFLRASDNQSCRTSEIVPITIGKNTSTSKTLSVETKSGLILKNASLNPYNVKISDSKGHTMTFKMEGNTSKNVLLPIGTASIEVTQVSGYLIYPTKEKFNQKIECKKVPGTLCFPSDRCK